VVLALTLGLSGCIPESRLYLGLVNGQLVIKTCEAIEASGVDVSEVTPDSDSVDGDVMWKVSGHATLNVGDVIVVGRAPAGMVTDVPYTGDISPTSAYGATRTSRRPCSDPSRARAWKRDDGCAPATRTPSTPPADADGVTKCHTRPVGG